jgi:hypothetical protein
MSENPVFIYAAVYSDLIGAEADYETLLDLHAADLIGTYDVALIDKDEAGKVHVLKHEKPTQHAPASASSPRPRSSGRRSSGARPAGCSGTSSAACRGATPRSSESSSTTGRRR